MQRHYKKNKTSLSSSMYSKYGSSTTKTAIFEERAIQKLVHAIVEKCMLTIRYFGYVDGWKEI